MTDRELERELSRIVEYYMADPDIYNYCYENSEEFRFLIDNADEEIKANIKKMQNATRLRNGLAVRDHIGTFGLSFIVKKAAAKRKLADVAEKIQTDEFKSLFKNLGEIYKAKAQNADM